MFLFEYMFANAIFIIFPMLLYLVYVINKKNMKEKESSLVLNVCLLASLYLSLYLFRYTSLTEHLFLSTTPILLAYLNNKKGIAILMSIILLDFIYVILNINIIICIILFILYFILYIVYEKRTLSNKVFTNLFSIFTILAVILNNFNDISNNFNILLEFIISISLFYITTLLIEFFLKKAKDILSLYVSVKEYEHEKQIKISLFKITHEIKNPIAVVKGYLDMFDVTNKDKSIKYINILKMEIERTLNLLNDFMDFTKIKIEKRQIDFNYLLNDVKSIIIPFCESKKVRYTFQTEENVVINADYNRLKQVILNILKNSIEASDKKEAFIYSTAFISDNKLYFIVKDNGMGMDKDTMERILTTPFYTTKEKGTGLGVCLSKEIIEAHNGSINYTSILGKFTITKVVLPLS